MYIAFIYTYISMYVCIIYNIFWKKLPNLGELGLILHIDGWALGPEKSNTLGLNK